jgi:signal transduction histidine kinase
MEENKDAKQIISQLLENHHTSVSMIAHEIRNPLTLVSSALQVIEAQHPEVRKFHNWEQMMEDVQFMCSLLTELSTFNNSSTLHHSVFSIERLLKNVAVSFAISLDADDSDIEFTSRIEPGMGDFTGDKIKLEEVLLNLLRNAREAVGEKGLISLTAGRREDRIIIQCRDNGCGISEDIMDTIFDPFVTSKENGTGLGLSSSKQTIEAHGGTIEAESSPKTGTVFTVTLPV